MEVLLIVLAIVSQLAGSEFLAIGVTPNEPDGLSDRASVHIDGVTRLGDGRMER